MKYDMSSSRCIGIVDSVSPNEIKGYLLDNAPSSLSIYEGNLTLFPRINGYLMIPNETGWLVCMISWIGYNHSKEPNEVNLPQGYRMIYLNTLGHIVKSFNDMIFERGVFSLPTVGENILLPTLEQLNCIVKNTDENTITIGTSPLAGDQEIKISVDSLFGRHLAVLGNTGSGKSCTVSGLIRWSIEQSIVKINEDEVSPNFRAIILDPNGEYRNTFDDLNNKLEISRFAVTPSKEEQINGVKQLNVPAWMWTSDEWASIVRATNATQLPILKQALRELKCSDMESAELEHVSDVMLNLEVYKLMLFIKTSISSQCYLTNEKKKFGECLKARNLNLKQLKGIIKDVDFSVNGLDNLIAYLDELDDKHYKRGSDPSGKYETYSPFELGELNQAFQIVNDIIGFIGKPIDTYLVSEDNPVQFNIDNLSDYVDKIAQEKDSLQYVQFMTTRIKSLLNNTVISSVINNKSEESLLKWIEDFLATNQNKGKLCIIDLSLLPLDVIHLLVAVIARLIFESLQRYRKHYGNELPTLLLMEEAHTFIKRYTDNADEFSSDKLSSKIFERIAREGRKFGLGMIVSSQRPSELSPTVLSQCNSYILHRIVNDKDQEMVKRLVPDNLGRLLDELPSLPQKKAIVLGAAVPIPTLVDINEIPLLQRPKSDDPKFWDVWTRKEPRESNWEPVVDRWQKKNNQPEDKE